MIPSIEATSSSSLSVMTRAEVSCSRKTFLALAEGPRPGEPFRGDLEPGLLEQSLQLGPPDSRKPDAHRRITPVVVRDEEGLGSRLHQSLPRVEVDPDGESGSVFPEAEEEPAGHPEGRRPIRRPFDHTRQRQGKPP